MVKSPKPTYLAPKFNSRNAPSLPGLAFESMIEFNRVEERKCACNPILVVDDEPINIFALNLLLKKFKMYADFATNGLDCVRMVKERLNKKCSCEKENYTLILMDLNMPIMDGFKATEAIRSLDIKQPAICAVTAFVDVGSR